MSLRSLIYMTVILMIASSAVASIVDFEDLTLSPESYWNGSDESGGFSSGSAYFENYYDPGFGSWAGFAYSNITDTVVEGWSGQYNAITGSGQAGSANYAVGYLDNYNGVTPTIQLDQSQVVDSVYVTNNNYAYYSMLNGDAFAKKFGGVSGDDPDWFLLTITGKDQAGTEVGTLDFYLADFRFANNDLDYILDGWTQVDLTSLGAVKSLEFSFSSSDVGEFGMNTPSYFVLDTIIPEPSSMILLGLGGLLLKSRKR